MIVEDGGLWEIRISVTLPATHAGMELPPTVIGRRASLGGSAAPSDWPCVLGPANGPPGGIWIGFIRRTVEHGQSIVAVTVTGSLRFPKLLSRRDIHAPSIVLMKMRNIEQKKMVPVISWDSCRGGGGGAPCRCLHSRLNQLSVMTGRLNIDWNHINGCLVFR